MEIINWKKGQLENLGVFIPSNITLLHDYIQNVGIDVIIEKFWSPRNNIIVILDFCALTAYWWKSKGIDSARVIIFKGKLLKLAHIFDKKDLRLRIDFRSPDVMGEHWIDDDVIRGHLHLKVGNYDRSDQTRITKRIVGKKYDHLGLVPVHYNRTAYGNVKIALCIKQK